TFAKNRMPPTSARADKQVVVAVPIEVNPTQTRTQFTQSPGQQRLAREVIKRLIDVLMGEQLTDIFEKRSGRLLRHTRGRNGRSRVAAVGGILGNLLQMCGRALLT